MLRVNNRVRLDTGRRLGVTNNAVVNNAVVNNAPLSNANVKLSPIRARKPVIISPVARRRHIPVTLNLDSILNQPAKRRGNKCIIKPDVFTGRRKAENVIQAPTEVIIAEPAKIDYTARKQKEKEDVYIGNRQTLEMLEEKKK